MPNWCYNQLQIPVISEDSKTTISDIKKKIFNSKDELDFQKIIPMPKSEEENWYDWSIDNWGTKWNASTEDVDIDDDRIYIRFNTAWSPPIPIIKKLHEMFDSEEVMITGHYEEEGWDYAGVYHREAMEVV